MSVGTIVLFVLWCVIAGGIGILHLFYPHKVQSWYVHRLQHGWEARLAPWFTRQVIAAKWSVWIIRLAGLVFLIMFFRGLWFFGQAYWR